MNNYIDRYIVSNIPGPLPANIPLAVDPCPRIANRSLASRLAASAR